MKNKGILLIGFVLLSMTMSGQDNNLVTVKAGTKINDYFTQSEQYRYPEFTQGKVAFRNGTSIVTRLNYSILVGEMQFLTEKDTMAIDNERDIRYVQIMKDTFYYDNGYLEVVAGHDPAIMTVKRYVKISDIKKEGPMGTRSSTSNAQAYGGIYDQGALRNHNLVLQEDLVLSKNQDYYIGNSAGGFLPYKMNNVLKLFPNNKTAIQDFLKKQKTDFKVKDDLIRLTEFLQGLK